MSVPGAFAISLTLCLQVFLGHCNEDYKCIISVSKIARPLVRGQGERG